MEIVMPILTMTDSEVQEYFQSIHNESQLTAFYERRMLGDSTVEAFLYALNIQQSQNEEK